MGYTHNWERPRILPRPQFIAAVEDCRRLCAALDIPLGGAGGEGKPVFTVDEICFNGRQACETFRIERVVPRRYPRDQSTDDWLGDFCKTNYRPYDLCVQGCLIVLSHHLGAEHFRVASDGKSHQWNDARNACQDVLGYGIDWGEGKLAPVLPSQQG